MSTFKCTIEYDGTSFAGWQVQPEERTVQDEVEQAIRRILGIPVRIVGAGRTDAGVHASGQVASFSAPCTLALPRLKKALNAVLPHDVAILSIEEVPDGFNARYDALSRTYRYTISTRRDALHRNHVWQAKYRLSPELLREATRPLSGPVNLKGFSKRNDDDGYDSIILRNDWTFRENMMIFEIGAVRFFQHSVRSIVGTAAEVARGHVPPDRIARILETGDRSLAGPTAPACGLCLINVEYGDMNGTLPRTAE